METFTEFGNFDPNVPNTGTAKGEIGGVLSCEATATPEEPPPPPPASCPDSTKKVKAIEFQYTGDSCGATTNFQLDSKGNEKFKCSGDPNNAEPVEVVITKDADKATVDPSTFGLTDKVTITATGATLRADTKFDIRQNSTVLQSLNIHTSCSKPLEVGDQFGSLLVTDLELVNK